jgi:hypothetical protein
MGNWHSIYHEALLMSLASMAVIFIVLVPVLWMLFSGFRLAMRFARRIGQYTRMRHCHLSSHSRSWPSRIDHLALLTKHHRDTTLRQTATSKYAGSGG